MNMVMTEVSWKAEDPATPALIIPMLQDERGTAPPDDCDMADALVQAVYYCRQRIETVNGTMDRVMTMAELSESAEHFINGFMAARTGEVKSY